MSSFDPWARLERILVDLSSRFADVPSSQVRIEIARGLQTVASFLRAEDYGLSEPVGDPESAWIRASSHCTARIPPAVAQIARRRQMT